MSPWQSERHEPRWPDLLLKDPACSAQRHYHEVGQIHKSLATHSHTHTPACREPGDICQGRDPPEQRPEGVQGIQNTQSVPVPSRSVEVDAPAQHSSHLLADSRRLKAEVATHAAYLCDTAFPRETAAAPAPRRAGSRR